MTSLSSQLLGHYSNVAKIVNCWRASGAASKIRKEYLKQYGKEASKAVARLPPRALTGRWGSVTTAEEFILKAGMDRLPNAFSAESLIELFLQTSQNNCYLLWSVISDQPHSELQINRTKIIESLTWFDLAWPGPSQTWRRNVCLNSGKFPI